MLTVSEWVAPKFGTSDIKEHNLLSSWQDSWYIVSNEYHHHNAAISINGLAITLHKICKYTYWLKKM